MSRIGYSMMKILGIEGKKIDIIPTTKGECLTEIYNKQGEYLGAMCYDKRVRWKKFVLVEIDKEMQMSRGCINEAFDLAEGYWGDDIAKGYYGGD